MKFQAPRGTRDILPPESDRWAEIEERTRRILGAYGYREVRTPMFEATDLFVRSVGESTDIVRKELYTFTDRGDRSLTLRPEGTAPLVRAYLEHAALRQETPARLSYIGPMFRYERPQAGRYRQFGQIGAELLGSKEPAADVEMIDLFVAIMRAIGLPTVTVLVNSLGDAACRPTYREGLRAYFESHRDALCDDDRERLKTNPLRILDCKNPKCEPVLANAPTVLDSLCGDCRAHFDAVAEGLRGLPFRVEVAPRLVRGLDYYTRTVFEVHAEGLGAQNAVGGGGRYDMLVKELGGAETPAIGFSIGMDRLVLATAASRAIETAGAPSRPDAFVVARAPELAGRALAVARSLRGDFGDAAADLLRVMSDVQARSASSQMKVASRAEARWVVFVNGPDDPLTVRDMAAGEDVADSFPNETALRPWLLARRGRPETNPPESA
jgi:histidyl-tRNA synthetase